MTREFHHPLARRKFLCLLASYVFCGSLNIAALTLEYVGSAPLADFRTTSILKPLDADGDNVFGTAGYVLYGTDVLGNGNAGAVVVANPLAYSSGTIQTKLSLPPWLSLVNNGQNRVAASYPSYPLIDDPAVAPASSVPDVQLGLTSRVNPIGTEASMVDLHFGNGIPGSGVRIGVVCFASTGDAMDIIRLASNSGDDDGVIRPGSGGVTIYLFDIIGAQMNDSLTLYLTKNISTGGNASIAYLGLTFDVLPFGVSPKVDVIEPVDQSTYAAPLNASIKGEARDLDGFVTNVAFYVNGIKIANDANPPFSGAWNVVSAGIYSLFAVATDTTGLFGTSSVVRVTVTNPPPKITRIHIANGLVSIAWESRPSADYRVETAISLPTLNWTPFSGVIAASNAVTSYSNGYDAEPKRFYRVVLLKN